MEPHHNLNHCCSLYFIVARYISKLLSKTQTHCEHPTYYQELWPKTFCFIILLYTTLTKFKNLLFFDFTAPGLNEGSIKEVKILFNQKILVQKSLICFLALQ
jgi:hypothetical protein